MAVPKYHANFRDIYPRGVSQGPRQTARDLYLRVAALLKGRGTGENWIRPIYGHHIFDDMVGNFQRILEMCLEVGSFITTADLEDFLSGSRPLDGRYFHLSFDDGFRNVISNGRALFETYGIRPLLFINPGKIGADPETALQFCRVALGHPGAIELATWDDIREAQDSCFDIGAHTSSHRRLTEISRDAELLEQEVGGCKQMIEDQLDRPCPWFAWPYGRAGDVDAAALAAIGRAGYRLCFSAIRGSYRGHVEKKPYVPRHHMGDYFPLAHARYFLAGGAEEL